MAQFKVGSRDKLRLRVVDVVVSAATKKQTITPVNLSGVSGLQAKCLFTPADGAAPTLVTKTFTPDADQDANTGYCERVWDTNDLIAGKLEVELEFVDSLGRLHVMPEPLHFHVAARLSA
jgi:hypothetical protein